MLPTRLTLLALACSALACGESTAELQKPPAKSPPPATQPTPDTSSAPAPSPDSSPAPSPSPNNSPTPTPAADAGSAGCGAQCAPTPDAAPTIALVSPAANTVVGGAVVLLSGEVLDDRPGVAVELSTDGVAWLGATVSDGGFALQLPLPTLDSAPLTLRARARDSAGQLAEVTRAVKVDNVAPQLAITSPAQGQKLNASHFAAGDAVPVRFTVSDGDPLTVVRQAGGATALEVRTSPTDNGQSYPVQLEAIDSAGNLATASVDFSVDRVAPQLASTFPESGAVTDAQYGEVRFTEPMQAAPAPLTIVPAAPLGGWTADRVGFSFELPVRDTLYTLSLAALADDHGNPLAAAPSWSVTTAPKLPTGETVIATSVSRYSVAADEDGVLTVVTEKGPYARTHRWDPRAGSFVSDPEVLVVPGERLQAYARSTRLPGQAPSRVAGARITSAATYPRVDWWLNRAAMTTPNLAAALVPLPGLDGEGAGLGRVGFIRNGLYERAGRQSLAVGVRPDVVDAVDGRWEVVQVDATGFTRQSFACTRPFANAAPLCGFSAPLTLAQFGSNPRYSRAMTRHCSFHAFNDANGNRTLYVEPFPDRCQLGSCPAPYTSAISMQEDLTLGTATATSLMAARRTSFGVAVIEYATDASCILTMGASIPLVASNVASFQPVRVGNKPALVWLDTGGTLRLYLP